MSQDLVTKHYPQLESKIEIINYAGLLDLSFYGSSLAMYAEIFLCPLNNEIVNLIYLCNSVLNTTTFIRNIYSRKTLGLKLRELINYLYQFDNVFNDINIEGVESLAKEIENIIYSIEGCLSGLEVIIYNIGKLLALWEHEMFYHDRPIRDTDILFLYDLLRKVNIPQYFDVQIREKLNNINDIEKDGLNVKRNRIPEVIKIIINKSLSTLQEDLKEY